MFLGLVFLTVSELTISHARNNEFYRILGWKYKVAIPIIHIPRREGTTP